jgi:general secretion pathway protein G
MDRYPAPEEGLKVLVDPPANDDARNGAGLTSNSFDHDPWGNPYQYAYPGTHHPTSFDVWSRGADGADGGEGSGHWQLVMRIKFSSRRGPMALR